MRIIGRKMYEVCENCGKIVCINKTILGSIHICTLPDEQRLHAREIRQTVQRTRQMLYGASALGVSPKSLIK